MNTQQESEEFFGYQLGSLNPKPQPGFRHRVSLEFEVQCRDTKLGEVVKVTGSCPELGDWDPGLGLVLSTSPSDFPNWKGLALIDAVGQRKVLEYKYLIASEADKAKRWEPIANNRAVALANHKEIYIQDVFGKPIHLREESTFIQPVKPEVQCPEQVSEDISSFSPETP